MMWVLSYFAGFAVYLLADPYTLVILRPTPVSSTRFRAPHPPTLRVSRTQ